MACNGIFQRLGSDISMPLHFLTTTLNYVAANIKNKTVVQRAEAMLRFSQACSCIGLRNFHERLLQWAEKLSLLSEKKILKDGKNMCVYKCKIYINSMPQIYTWYILQRQQTRTSCIGGCSINTCAHVACSCATWRPCVAFLCRRCPSTACQLKLKPTEHAKVSL